MPSNEHYLRRVTPQHRHPKFMKWLAANLMPHLEAEKVLLSMDEAFDLDYARGKQLDVLGEIIGRSRVLSFDPIDGSSPVLQDDIYETLIRAKISINQWNGTIPGIQELWESLFPDYRIVIHDNQDMTMDLYIIGLVTMLEMELMSRGYIAPKPMGVRLNYTFIPPWEEEDVGVYFAEGAAYSIRQIIDCDEFPLPTDAYDFYATATAQFTREYIITDVTEIPNELPVNSATGTYQIIKEVYAE